ncbi:MAG: chemotaxis protein CheW [Bacteroidia bacterium]|nr:chemotaxis protein CheW [Bacteroidia bacterium]
MFDVLHTAIATASSRMLKDRAPLRADHPSSLPADEDVLRQRAIEYSQPRKSEETSRSHEMEVLTVQLGTDAYALPCADVDEVVPLHNMVSLPNTPTGIIGLSSNRGVLFAVLDPKPQLQIPGTNITTMHRVVILRHDRFRIGILVDSILGMTSIATDTVRPVPTFLAAEKRKFISGMTEHRTLLIDVPRFLDALNSTEP